MSSVQRPGRNTQSELWLNVARPQTTEVFSVGAPFEASRAREPTAGHEDVLGIVGSGRLLNSIPQIPFHGMHPGLSDGAG